MTSLKSPTEVLPSGFFVLRAPLLPFDELPASHDQLRALLAQPDVRDAIFIASPSLEARLDVWQREPNSKSGRKVERALMRYLARMSGRATPFGLFAGCSLGTVGRKTRLTVSGACGRHTRLDMDYVVALCDALSRDPHVRPHLRFTPNSSLYRAGGRARYLEVRRRGDRWSHHRASLATPDYLVAVLQRATGGATPDELARALLDHDREASDVEAAEYIAELIDQQILVSELVPAVTGPEPIHGLIARLDELPGGAVAAGHLSWVRDELIALDADGPGAAPDRYRAVAVRLAELPATVDESRLLQVDLVRPANECTLGDNVVSEFLSGVELLRRLTPRPRDDALAAFRQAFTERFGDTPATREVPLAEALDDQTGVGFGQEGQTIEASSLLEGLPLSPPAERRIAWGARERWLLARLTETLAAGGQEWALTEQDVERLSVPDPLPIPDAFAAIGRIAAESADAVNRGDFRLFLASVVGPSGARLLGRFCHADAELAAAVADHLHAEEALQPDAVFAEIAHLPERGNLVSRPADRSYEIPYLGRSVAKVERILPLSDLRVSVRGTRIVLRSERLNCEIIPRLTTAHNFEIGDGFYRFLCALQEQWVASRLAWDWGPLAASAFLPRVTFGRLVLARARWRASKTDVVSLGGPALPAALQHWRRERRLPRWVCIAEGDNELPIDFDNPLTVEILAGQLETHDDVSLVELFPDPQRLCAAGPDGRYVHELIVPFAKRAEATPHRNGSAPRPARIATKGRRRVFPPGSEWLTVKLYAGSIVSDDLLRDVVGPLACELVAAGSARRWFFIRYADPHEHLRLRFEGEPVPLVASVLPQLQAAVEPLLADGRIWKTQLDTYEREIERYGGPAGIGPCEQLFHHDSEAVVELLGLLDGDQRGDRRWRLALLGMDRLLTDLGLDLNGKRAVLQRIRNGAGEELRLKELGARFRAEAPSLATLLDTSAAAPEWAAARTILDRRTIRNRPAVGALTDAASCEGLTSSLLELAPSLLHMHANRLLRSAHRVQEMVLYEFLYRSFESQAARRRTQPSKQADPAPNQMQACALP